MSQARYFANQIRAAVRDAGRAGARVFIDGARVRVLSTDPEEPGDVLVDLHEDPRCDRASILAALVKTSGNVGKAALLLKVARRTLDKRITGLGLRAKVTELYPRSVRQPRRSA